MRIVSIGECMVEVAPGERAGTHVLGFAGDTLNTAWYLKRLRPGWQVDYVSAVGRDDISDRMIAFLEGAGIGVDHVRRVAGRTVGLYLITLADGERSFAYWRGQSAARRLAEESALLAKAVEGADCVFFSGITLAILEGRGRETLAKVLADARAAGACIAFDPNYRPALWPDRETAQRAIADAAQAADIVLPSYDEEALLFADPSPDATIARYLTDRTRAIVVKNGAAPIRFFVSGERGAFAPDPVNPVVDTTAAGDSFNAGFLAGFLDGEGAETAIGRAAGLAAQVVRHRGALVPLDPTPGRTQGADG